MISLFSTNLIVVLALTLFEKRILTICHNFLLSDTEFTSIFAKYSFWLLYCFFFFFCTLALFFVFFSRNFCPTTQKIVSRSIESFIIALCKAFVTNPP